LKRLDRLEKKFAAHDSPASGAQESAGQE